MVNTRKKRIMKLAKGFHGKRRNCWRISRLAVWKALQHAYKNRKLFRRDNRKLWNQQINAASRQHGVKYSQFMYGNGLGRVGLNRKMLAELAQKEPLSFFSVLQLSTLSRQIVVDFDMDKETKRLNYDLDFPDEFSVEGTTERQDKYDKVANSVQKRLQQIMEQQMDEDIAFEEKIQDKKDDYYF